MEKLKILKDFIEAVIIDEASQCIEIESLIPLKYSPNRVILIGDPKQLPATTFQKNSS
jgi:senataxin